MAWRALVRPRKLLYDYINPNTTTTLSFPSHHVESSSPSTYKHFNFRVSTETTTADLSSVLLKKGINLIGLIDGYSSEISVTGLRNVKSETILPNLGNRWMVQVVSSKREDCDKDVDGLSTAKANLLSVIFKLFSFMLPSTFQDKMKEETLCSPCGIVLNGKTLSPLGSNKADFKLKQEGRFAGRSCGGFATFASNEVALDKITNGTQRISFITFKSSGAMGNGSQGHAHFSTTVDSYSESTAAPTLARLNQGTRRSRLSWHRLDLLEKFGNDWWIGTLDGVSYDDEFDSGFYLLSYKKVGRFYMEFLECWSYQAISVAKHDQLKAELNSFLLILCAASQKNVSWLILRSDSEQGIHIINHIWRKRTLIYLSLNKQCQFTDVLSEILIQMSSFTKIICVHFKKRDNILANIISRLPNQLQNKRQVKYLQQHLIVQKVKMVDPLFEYYSEGILFKELRWGFRDQL